MERIGPTDRECQAVGLTKSSLRRQALLRRKQMPEEERRRASLKAAERIIGHQWFYGSDKVLLFKSYGTEIDTEEIINEALDKKKALYFPRVEGEEMHFYRVRSKKELFPGFHGIMEPDGTGEKYCYKEEEAASTLMLMPGAAFDTYRNRIGYGRGFYDRFLADKPLLQLRTIAIGFQCQLINEQIPAGENDIRPYQVILV